MISETTIDKLNNLSNEAKKIHDEKEELSKIIQEETEAKKVRLLCMDNTYYNIYLTYTNEKEDIKDIAKQLGYILERTFKSSDEYIYLLTVI